MEMRDDRLKRFVLVTTLALVLGGVKSGAAGTVPKVTICHFPPGNPANVQVITVGATAVPAHVRLHNDAVCPAGASNCCFGDKTPSVCTNFQSDVNNCGECGNVCSLPNATPECTSGACTIASCDPGFGDCNSDPADGCETSLTSDPNNCGGCGVVCSAAQVCTSGECVAECAPDETLCDGVCVNENTDPNNCGGCGTVCPTGQACASGVCTTNPNPECEGQTCSTFTTCNPSACGGQGVCFSTAEGGGFCGASVQCAGLAPCAASTDCASGEICQVNTCCGSAGVCVPASSLCQ
jgi:hypothetical protein